MKYYLYETEVIDADEYKHYSFSTHVLSLDVDVDKHADEHVKDFYYGPAETAKGIEGTYFFNSGTIACKIASIQELTEEEYNVFRKFNF